MDTVTYPDYRTAHFIHEFMIPLRVTLNSPPSWASRWVIQYTPTVITLDEDGREHHRTVGFLPPDEFIPELMLGNAKAYLQNGRAAKARTFFNRLLQEYPGSRSAALAAELRRKITL